MRQGWRERGEMQHSTNMQGDDTHRGSRRRTRRSDDEGWMHPHQHQHHQHPLLLLALVLLCISTSIITHAPSSIATSVQASSIAELSPATAIEHPPSDLFAGSSMGLGLGIVNHLSIDATAAAASNAPYVYKGREDWMNGDVAEQDDDASIHAPVDSGRRWPGSVVTYESASDSEVQRRPSRWRTLMHVGASLIQAGSNVIQGMLGGGGGGSNDGDGNSGQLLTSTQQHPPVLPLIPSDNALDLLDLNDDEDVQLRMRPPATTTRLLEPVPVGSVTESKQNVGVGAVKRRSNRTRSRSYKHDSRRAMLPSPLIDAIHASSMIYPTNISAVYRGAWSVEMEDDESHGLSMDMGLRMGFGLGDASSSTLMGGMGMEELGGMDGEEMLNAPGEFEAREGIVIYLLRSYPTLPAPSSSSSSPAFSAPSSDSDSNSPPSSFSSLLVPTISLVDGELVVRDGHYSSVRDMRFRVQGLYESMTGRLTVFSTGGDNSDGGGENDEDRQQQSNAWYHVDNIRRVLTPPAILDQGGNATEMDAYVAEVSERLNRTAAVVAEWNGRASSSSSSSSSPSSSNADTSSDGAVTSSSSSSASSDTSSNEPRKRYSDCALTMSFQVHPIGGSSASTSRSPSGSGNAFSPSDQSDSDSDTATDSERLRRHLRRAVVGEKYRGQTSASSSVKRRLLETVSWSTGAAESAAAAASSTLSHSSSAPSVPHSLRPLSEAESSPMGMASVSFSLRQAFASNMLQMSGFISSTPSSCPASSASSSFSSSPNPGCHVCNFRLRVHSTVLRIDSFFRKAINFAYLGSALAIIQILMVVQQTKRASTASASSRLSLLSVAMQALMDAYASLFHIFLAMSFEPLFNAFVVTAFLQFILFALFEMRFIFLLFKVHNPTLFSMGWESGRRALRLLYLRFYACLIGGLLLVYSWPKLLPLLLFGLYSFWLPQILLQAVLGSRRGLVPRFILGTSLVRFVIPGYFLLCPENFLQVPPSPWMALLLAAWMGVQMLVLRLQRKWGARFFVPKRFLPHRYDYHRSIPLLSLGRRRGSRSGQGSRRGSVSVSSNGNAVTTRTIHVQPTPAADIDGVGGHDVDKDKETGSVALSAPSTDTSAPPSSTSSIAATSAPSSSDDDAENPCAICYSELEYDPADPQSLMVCPCDHVFHSSCLRRWMKLKQECPICRAVLPVEEDEEAEDEDEDVSDEEDESDNEGRVRVAMDIEHGMRGGDGRAAAYEHDPPLVFDVDPPVNDESDHHHGPLLNLQPHLGHIHGVLWGRLAHEQHQHQHPHRLPVPLPILERLGQLHPAAGRASHSTSHDFNA